MAKNGGMLTQSLLVLRTFTGAVADGADGAEEVAVPVQLGAGLVMAVHKIEMNPENLLIEATGAGLFVGIGTNPGRTADAFSTWAGADDLIAYATWHQDALTSGGAGGLYTYVTDFNEFPVYIWRNFQILIDNNSGASQRVTVALYYTVKKVSDSELGRLALLAA